MRDAITSAPVIGEIGLDGAVRTPMEYQLAALRGILTVASDMPRLLSVHSYRATSLFRRDNGELHLVEHAGECRAEAPPVSDRRGLD
jgi:hypothetical protein